jgi:hypothetical protein
MGGAADAVRTLLDTVTASVGRSVSELLALRILALRGPNVSPSGLHDLLARQCQLGLDHAAITRLLKRLQDEELATST